MKKWNLTALVVLAVACGAVLAHAVGLSGVIVNEPGLAYSKRFVTDLNAAAVNTISATADYSSATFAGSSFGTGQVSTGSFLVVDNTLLSSAAAIDSITVASTSGAIGDSILIPYLAKPGAYVFRAGRDWNYKATTALTAASIKTALDTIPWLSTNRVGAVIYSTAPVGAFYNSIAVVTNNPATITVASATFLGGRDAVIVSVNGRQLRAGAQFAVGGTAALTATAIANAVNASAALAPYLTAATATSSVTLVSDKAGTYYDFPLATSNSAAVSVLHPALVGGLTPAWTLNGKNIAVPAHGFTLALPVLYSTGTGAPAIGGLVNQTTYYAIPVDADTVQLATSSAQAVLRVGTVLTSTSTLAAAKTYSLAPLAFVAESAGFAWQVSNDNSSWSNLAVTSVTFSGAGTTSWDLGRINYRFLGLNVTGPTSGGLQLRVTAQGTTSF